MSVRHFAELLDSLPVAFVGHDDAGRVTLWNSAATELLGWKRDACLGQPSPLPEALSRAKVPQTPAAVRPITVKREDGTELSLLSATMPLGLPGFDGSASALWRPDAISFSDELKLRAMCQHAPEGVVALDANGAILDANPAFASMLGTDHQALLGRALASLTVDPAVERKLHLPASTSQLTAEAISLRRADGKELVVDVLATSFATNRWVGFVRDVTASAHHRAQLALFGRIFEATAEAILITDADNAIVAANPAFSEITGYSLEEVRGKNPRLLSSGRHDRAFYERLWHTLTRDGHWQGELWNRRKDGGVFPEWATLTVIRDDRGRVTNHVAIFSDISSAKRTEAQLVYLAHHDHLTGLPNRTLLFDRLDQALASSARDGTSVALLLVDLDDFKTVNGSVGHHLGDEALRTIAHRLKRLLRQSDTVARMGGDEFAVLVPGLSDERDSFEVVQKVLAAVAAPISVEREEVSLTASLGIALAPQDATDAPELFRAADAALYSTRGSGRGTWRYFTDELDGRARERLSLLNSLGRAIERNELRLHFQPQWDIGGRRLISAEALLRWQRGNELVPPGRFIQAADESGLIVPIGAWVLKEACRRAAVWKVPIAVNVSVRQLDAQFVELVTSSLSEAGLEASLLELEITESIVMEPGDECVGRLRVLRDRGVRIAMDDFGTGYSSLSQLRRLPLTRLKIDRAFVQHLLSNPADRAVAEAVVTLGRALSLEVLAEGIETEAQRQELERMGCGEAQGYLLGHPVDATAFEALLSRTNAPR